LLLVFPSFFVIYHGFHSMVHSGRRVFLRNDLRDQSPLHLESSSSYHRSTDVPLPSLGLFPSHCVNEPAFLFFPPSVSPSGRNAHFFPTTCQSLTGSSFDVAGCIFVQYPRFWPPTFSFILISFWLLSLFHFSLRLWLLFLVPNDVGFFFLGAL